MEPTKLLYLGDFKRYSCQAQVLTMQLHESGKTAVILDQTVFYPQGGGQPCDTGTITAGNAVFTVTEVRLIDGVVNHVGAFNGNSFTSGQTVTGTVDSVRRILNSRVHSAGHVLDKVIFELGYTWEPGKSYHFPNGPYVEYNGSLAGIDGAQLKAEIEKKCADWCANGMPVTVKALNKQQVVSDEQLKRRCAFVVNLPADTPIYVITFGDNFSSPCSGTHVSNVSEIGGITIRKIKESDGAIRVSYDIVR